MGSSIDTKLKHSLLTIEEQFLNAAGQGAESLACFATTWSVLQQEIAAAQKTSSLDNETVSMAHAVAASLTVICQSFLDVGNTEYSCSSRLMSEWRDVMDADLPLSKPSSGRPFTPSPSPSPAPRRVLKPYLQSLRHPTTTPISSALVAILPSRNPSSAASVTESTRSASDPNPLPEFIEHAYKYFVANLFNPYPSRDEKQAIVDKTNNTRVTLTSVSNWFTNARRRCGWAEILKGRCNGNREVMVDLAKRVFVKSDPRNPVDPAIVAEFVEMKEAVESMYERKTRTSAWIEELEDLDELVNPMTEDQRQAAKKRETEEDREARRREKEMQKEQREFERQKRKMQAEALRKADRVTKKMQREQEKEKKKEQCTASFAVPYPPQSYEDGESSVPEATPVAGGKRKLEDGDSDFYGFPGLRNASPAPSLSSSFTSEVSSISRVPSLTWSDSGDERPYKRSRCSPFTPSASSPSLSPALEIPASFDYSFTFEPPSGLTTDPAAFDSIFDFSVNPCETIMVPPPTKPVRGQKRLHDAEDGEPTPRAKRAKPLVASADPELTPAPSTPLFTPTPSLDGTPTQFGRRRSSLIPIDLDTVLGLDQAHPQPVQITPPDSSVPLEVGVYDWSSSANPGLDQFDPTAALDPQGDFSQLFQLFTDSLPEQSQQPQLDSHLEVPAFDLSSPVFLPQEHDTPSTFPTAELPGEQCLDLSGLMSGLTDEALNDMGLDFSASVPPTPPDLSRSSSVSPETSPAPVTPSAEALPTPTELADKALNKERKRRALEEKRAALAREQARLAEEERELEDD